MIIILGIACIAIGLGIAYVITHLGSAELYVFEEGEVKQ